MTTAEKRAELDARGEVWPVCECHGEPCLWQAYKQDGYFRCRIRVRETRKRIRDGLKAEGRCIFCGDALATETRCERCRNQHNADMGAPRRKLGHLVAGQRYRQRRRASEGFQSTGAGMAAFAAYMTANRGG